MNFYRSRPKIPIWLKARKISTEANNFHRINSTEHHHHQIIFFIDNVVMCNSITRMWIRRYACCISGWTNYIKFYSGPVSCNQLRLMVIQVLKMMHWCTNFRVAAMLFQTMLLHPLWTPECIIMCHFKTEITKFLGRWLGRGVPPPNILLISAPKTSRLSLHCLTWTTPTLVTDLHFTPMMP